MKNKKDVFDSHIVSPLTRVNVTVSAWRRGRGQPEGDAHAG